MSDAKPEIAEGWNFAADFPELPPNLIERPHLLRTMIEALSSEAPILFLECDDGDGATTTLAQFCRTYPEQSFALFIKPASRVTYGLEYLRLSLAEQFNWYVYGEKLNRDLLSSAEFEDLRLKALRRSRTTVLYFVIDGLHQIPAEDLAVVSSVFKELLPTGVPNCRFIVTGQQSELGAFIHGSVKSKHYRLLKFSLEETRQFMVNTGIEQSECEQVHELCKFGSPGLLASVRRLLLNGTSLAAVIDTDPGKYLEFVKLEFEALDRLNNQEQLVVASVAFGKISQSVEEVSIVTGLPKIAVEAVIADCPFLRYSARGQVEFISETHRKYAAKRLAALETAAIEAQLTFLQERPRSEAALRFLPAYLEQLDRQDAIIQLLSKDYYGDLLETTQSFAALKAQAEMGARSAQALQRTHDVFKFSLQRSIFASAISADGSADRIRALVALGKSNAAMALANAEATKEGRLALLSAFARRLWERRGSLDPEILDYIRRLTSEVDFGSMGDRAMSIAADVLFFEPDVAIGIIESAVKGATSAKRDAAFAELSFSTSIAKLKHNAKVEDKARPRISDRALQQVAYSFELMAKKLDIPELMDMLARMPPAHQVHFIRSLVSIKRTDPRALDLVELGLDIVIRETEYTPRAKDLAELCAPFMAPTIEIERVKRLVTRIESQVGLVGKASQSRDLTVLQMRLAAAEFQFDREQARQRILQAYEQVSDTKTPEARMECLAIMLGMLSTIDTEGVLEDRDGFRAVIRSDLNELLAEILKDTADHISTISSVLKALAADDCSAALAVASKLNTQPRRDAAYQMVVNVLVGQSFSTDRRAALISALASITCPDLRSRAVVDLLAYLEANPDKAHWVPQMEELRAQLMRGYELSYWDCWMFKAAPSAGCEFRPDLLSDRIEEALSRTGSPLEEAKILFRAAEALADRDESLAQQYYERGVRASKTSPFGAPSTSNLFEMCLSLVSRSMAPVAKALALDDDKLTRHVALVDKLPGIIPRTRILNELAERMWCAKRQDLTSRLVNEHIRPILELARSTHPSVGRAALRLAFPSLCAAHLGMAVPLLGELSDSDADDALFDAAMLRIRHLSGQEPDMNGKFDYSKIDATDFADVIELMRATRMDSTLFALIEALVGAATDRQNKTRFTATQKADWSGKIRSIIGDKLPDPKNIKHDGFRIVCMAQAYALTEVAWSQWQALEDQTAEVDNCADRSYIYTKLAVCLPNRYAASHRARLLEKARLEIDRIPSPIDRVSHLQDYAQDAHSHDATTSARECLKAAMRISIEIEDQAKISSHRRELIDIADQMDPGLADELIEMVDDDPARVQLKADAKRAAALAKAKRALANAKDPRETTACGIDMLPMAAWRNLAALEAGRLEVKPLEVMTQYVTMASTGSLSDAYPVLSWHLANLERKYVTQQDIRSHLIPVCEALLLSAELTFSILRKVSGTEAEVREEGAETGGLVRRQQRAEAIAFIERWIQEHSTGPIIYCDAYFSSKDIPLLRLCLANAPGSQVRILGSKVQLSEARELGAEVFEKAWREQSDQDPPDTEIIALAYADSPSKHVIHDRWLLSGDAGLRLGTSFNSLGLERLSEISVMEPVRVSTLREQVDKYLNRQRVVDGMRIQYTSFTL